MKIWALCGLMGLLFVCQAATAQSQTAQPRRSVSYSTWLLEENLVTARLVLPAAEAASLVGKSMPLLSTESLAKYVFAHVSVSAGASPCEPTDQGYDIGKINSLSLGQNLYGFEIFFRCSHGGTISLHNALLFAEAPQHVDFARLERGGVHATQLFTAARPVVSIPDAGELPPAGVGRFLMLGGSHLWHSVELLCAMVGFFVLTRTRRQFWTVLAALALGYAASLVLVGGGLIPDVAVLDSGVGFVVACVAAIMVTRSLREQRVAGVQMAVTTMACILIAGILISSIGVALLHRPAAAWVLSGCVIIGGALVGVMLTGGGASLSTLILPAVAGLLDGLVLPGDYARLRESGELTSSNLAAFDAGALLSETLLLAALAAAAAFVIGRAWQRRIGTEGFAGLAGDIAAAAFAGFGSFWLLSRLH